MFASSCCRRSAALLLLACTPWTWAQPASTPAGSDAVAAINHTVAVDALHDELRQLRDTMQTALNQRDLEGLLAHLTDDVVFTTMNGDRVIGKEGIRQYFHQMLNGPDATVKAVAAEFEVAALSHLYDGDTAVAFGHSTDRYTLANGDTWTVNPQWSSTMVRQNGQWRIAQFHYSVNMFDNPILATQRRWLIGGGAAAAVLAGMAGFVLGRRRRT